MIYYDKVYTVTEDLVLLREGLRNPKNIKDFSIYVSQLAGIFCGLAHQNDISTQTVVEFIKRIQDQKIVNIVNDGSVNQIEDLISDSITKHPLYYITERELMKYKPSSTQVGPGELFMCLYDADSVFSVDNTAGFDIITDNVPTELKSEGTNQTTPELFDKYAADPRCERLLVVKPVGTGVKPRFRSRYASIDVVNWREAYYHRNGKRLSYKEAI